MAVSHHRRFAPRPTVLLALTALAGCGGGSEPSTPTAIAVAPTAITFTAIGQTQQLTAAITDQDNNPVDGSEVDWSSSNPAVATVSSTGLVTATGTGAAQVTAAVGGIAAIATVEVTQTVADFEAVGGGGQSGGAGAALPQSLVVEATDALGNPIQGLAVEFRVAAGGGSVQPASASTALDGRASAVFTLGSDVGSPQQVTATLAGTDLVVTFAATATSGFDITLRYLSTPTSAQGEAFASAVARWETIIIGDVADLRANAAAASCGENSPALAQVVDDILIFITLEPIDGPGSVLGAAGPCFIRVPGNLSVVGRMRFDTDDLAVLEQEGALQDVILHEMGHVLGIGTLWPQFGLLVGPSLSGGLDPHFAGAGAISAFNAAGGGTYAGGNKVPVEATGGLGTADSHWRETVLDNELMTGFVAQAGNPLSAITVRSLADMGYVVNLSGADSFTLGAALRAGPFARRWHLENDVIRGPIYRMDQTGTVVGVVHP